MSTTSDIRNGLCIKFNHDIYKIIEMYCKVQSIFPSDYSIHTTKYGSLLYKREKQLVGREIFVLKLKILTFFNVFLLFK